MCIVEEICFCAFLHAAIVLDGGNMTLYDLITSNSIIWEHLEPFNELIPTLRTGSRTGECGMYSAMILLCCLMSWLAGDVEEGVCYAPVNVGHEATKQEQF